MVLPIPPLLERLYVWLLTDAINLLKIFVIAALLIKLVRGLDGRLLRWANRNQMTPYREQQIRTVTTVVHSMGTALVIIVAGMMALREIGLDVRPILAGAGVIGVAVGFGAQHLVRDVIAGIFILVDDKPGTKGFSPHQDNYYNRADPNDGIAAAWMALEDVDKENGALGIFPASHLNGLAATRRDWVYLLSRSPDVAKSLLRLASPKFRSGDDDSSVIERFVYAEAPDDIKPMPVVLKAGSVVFMHGDAIHLSYPNQTKDRSRQSLLTNFVRIGTQFSAGKLSGRVPFDVYANS